MITTPIAAPVRRVRSRQRGQSLVIFSLIAVVIFGVVGFAVDGGFSYFVSDKLERGAMAAALAGVPNMPNFNTGPNDASSTAVTAASLNGWTTGGATNVSISVAKVWDASTSTYYRNRLQVTVAADVPVFFMKLLGFGTHREARTAVAEYLRPITFGQPGTQIGSDLASLGTGNSFYFMRSEGWGTDRGQGDAYGPNPLGWGANASSPNIDVHALSGVKGTEAATQPLTMPARGGANYTVYVPNGQTATIQVYNPLFAPDSQTSTGNAQGYNYHEDDGDFPENCATSPCTAPSNIQQWPTMSYTIYKTPNPFDHTADVWYSNLRIKSIDATKGPSLGTYSVPGSTTTCTTAAPCALTGLGNTYHRLVDVAAGSTDAAAAQLSTRTVSASNAALTGASPNGTTYRLRVDQLDDLNGDPGANGRPQNQNSQAHKGYAVGVAGCATCSITALNDVTLYTPLKSGGGQIPLVSIPPEYAGHQFSLYVYDPGDVTCNASGCSNVLTVMRPNGVSNPQVAVTGGGGIFATGAGQGDANNAASWSQQVTPCSTCPLSIDTQDPTANPKNKFNGRWLRFDIAVPSDYATADINAATPSTWFWNLNYSTAQPAGDTITANLGFTGAPVHIISG